MTPSAKKTLSSTIRGLRERLLEDLRSSTEAEYRLAVRARDAGLSESASIRRKRLENWVEEQLRAEAEAALEKKRKAAWTAERLQTERAKLLDALRAGEVAEGFHRQVELEAAYTLLHRVVVLRLMEATPEGGGTPLRAPAVVTGGWESRGYKDFRSLAPALVHGDETEGYAFLLQLVFEDLAQDLPGLFGPAGVADLVSIPPATLRHVVEALDDAELASCWTDDMTLGWVYQYWNDPAREALDAKLNSGGKVEPHEIASKTQMFTERYMVDWTLQNALAPLWLAMCKKHGWTPWVEADGTLDRLEERRVDWRGKRDRGEVSLTELMPLHTDAERQWAYYLAQPLPDDAIEHAPDSLRDLKLMDPAVGSGHFLVVALDLLFALVKEERGHRQVAGEALDSARWSDTALVERILSHTLHGIDLDPRAVQIAAATLWLKACQLAPDARPTKLNLVASRLRLASLPDDDPALVELRLEVERETGIPGALTDTIVHALRGADHLGSLLKVDKAVDHALSQHEAELGRLKVEQGGLFTGFGDVKERVTVGKAEAKATLLDRLEDFLSRHTGGEDLGLRLRGQQLAAGVRFLRLMREGSYHLVVGNPPYQTTSKMTDAGYIRAHYQRGKADLYAAFLERGLQLCLEGGSSALLTMRNWMFTRQYVEIRTELLAAFDLRALGDFAIGAFDDVPNDVLSVAAAVIRRSAPPGMQMVYIQPTPPDDRSYDRERTMRKRAATLSHEGLGRFETAQLEPVPERPLVYWWSEETLDLYATLPLLGALYDVRKGIITGDGARFDRMCWEVDGNAGLASFRIAEAVAARKRIDRWVPTLKGGQGRKWIEPLREVIHWALEGLQLKTKHEARYGSFTKRVQSMDKYFSVGIAFSPIGNRFDARAHRYHSVFGNAGSSVFPPQSQVPQVLCLLNSSQSAGILESLNPSINFEVGDVGRLPVVSTPGASYVFETLDATFSRHESHRESSVEFTNPGPSSWRHAQDWAQLAVDRPEGASLPEYIEQLDPEPPTDQVSFALGVALGRFGPPNADGVGMGILDPRPISNGGDDLAHALPAGILFLDGTLDSPTTGDDLGHPAARWLHTAWTTHGPAIDTKRDTLRDYLRLDFFKDVHRTMYDNRPIHWPLSSSGKTFVAWVTIHRWTGDTLTELLAKLADVQKRLDGELPDLRAARDGADRRAAREAEKRLGKVQKWRAELADFIRDVEQCALRGPPPTNANATKCPPRRRDARYDPDLDDGVMINSAALWPLLQPQWKDPKKWWTELALGKGRKDYDWSHLAMRYWPTRVDAKCQDDPSLGVAHGCFWRYHPERAWAWELRLQDEIGPDFRIEEGAYTHPDGTQSPDHSALRAAYLAAHPDEALAAVEKEVLRRRGRGKDKTDQAEMQLLETGLWSAQAKACWDLETRIIEKQEAPFQLSAPDEAAARASLLAQSPRLAREREELLLQVQPVTLFPGGDR